MSAGGPLSGVRVLDLCSVVSGPMTAVVLADQGADVIKVEPPGWGDGIRGLGAQRNGVSAMFAMINRNKRSVGINLKHSEGAAIARLLAETSDVVIQNYRPGKMAKLGLGYDDLRPLNPELIYASINGMGEVGPYAEQRVYDFVIQGISGVVDAQSEDKPQTVRTIIYDKVTALIAAQGITAALFARANGAGGQQIRLSMLDAGVYFNWPDLMWNYSFEGDNVSYAGDLADMYAINKTSDGAVISHQLGADTSQYSTEELVGILAANEIPALILVPMSSQTHKCWQPACSNRLIIPGVVECANPDPRYSSKVRPLHIVTPPQQWVSTRWKCSANWVWTSRICKHSPGKG